jgi:sialic acid synthase SpsE
MGIGVAVGSIALGATIIEKHFTISRAEKGVDSAFSMEPDEMKSLVLEAERVWRSLGNVSYGPTSEEKKSLKFRRSIYVVKDIKPGDILTKDNLRVIRPGFGLAPKYYDQLIGKTAAKEVKAGTPTDFSLLEE